MTRKKKQSKVVAEQMDCESNVHDVDVDDESVQIKLIAQEDDMPPHPMDDLDHFKLDLGIDVERIQDVAKEINDKARETLSDLPTFNVENEDSPTKTTGKRIIIRKITLEGVEIEL